MTLQSALWKHSPVTVKHVKGQEDGRTLVRREVDILRRLQHPHLAKLLAVCLDPNPDHICLVMEHFQFASLNHLLHKTQVNMSLPERINILMDIAKGMIYIHRLSIIHGFLNSFSVFIDEKLKAKIGNLEFSQKVGDIKHEIACCGIQKNWMAPEQISHEPPDTLTASDVYSFGAPMWETLARKVPWSWLTGITLKQALCRDRMTLPMLEIWPGEIESVMKKCFNDAVDRPNFCSVHEYLSTIENSGGGLTSEVLDGAFPDWCEVHLGSIQNATQRVRTRGTSGAQPSLSTTRREREVEQYGYQIAKQLELDRDIRRRSRRYSRPTWAKEVALTRAIARDLERVQNYTWKTYDTASKDKTSIRRGRKHSVLNEETFDRLLTTSSKYLKKDWSKVLHGMGKLKKLDERIKGKG
ncbi:probable serine/threonine-protein kinase DDB_G0267514 [Stylophora pistillata]|uniref:probable serine/threonine-protein kinase DDB_G0267514 n=1 Tax=Stylophora pistillata TaxID=50429 RepID=UPI000C03DB27|nr:probable serine/threonine-protein kinase DDB_G0267514 [Stylophora pistillata]